jgi:hypothetical protein
MAMEFIRVRFDPNDVRDVIASGNVIGETETELAVEPTAASAPRLPTGR